MRVSVESALRLGSFRLHLVDIVGDSITLLFHRLPAVGEVLGRPFLRKMPSRANRRTNGAEGAQMQHRLHVEAPPLFDLGLAVSSYGFFMLPPNQWVKVCFRFSHNQSSQSALAHLLPLMT